MTDTSIVFIVSGALNRGKSSIVSTLTENDDIAVSAIPGTTRKANRYDYQIGGRSLYSLVDTPGFERPVKALYTLETETNPSLSYPQRLNELFSSPEIQKRFPEETEILLPILKGGAIIYVVDTSLPPSAASHAEMELLRRTGQARIALINKQSAGHDDLWLSLLNQYFNIIRHFDAAKAGFNERIKLLSVLRDIDPRWYEELDPVIETLKTEWIDRNNEALQNISKLISDILQVRIDKSFETLSNMEENRKILRKSFLDKLLELEKVYQQNIRRIFKHKRYKSGLEVNQETQSADFYDLKQWEGLGIPKEKFALTMAVIGGATGFAADLAMGGWSGGLPSILSATFFGGAAWFGYDSIEVSKKRVGKHRLLFLIKPKSAYPFIILDRAIAYYLFIKTYAHGRRDDAAPPKSINIIGKAEQQQLKNLTNIFKILSKTDTTAYLTIEKERQKLQEIIAVLLEDEQQ
ncbi:MAG TPA: DUF3482 domain-containing protein [Candidatus Marinimicrobia bacterium]|nr:DUF3482 domain-containing protein [Candidatus Neomarinimicrobiota bacterium]